MPIHFKEFVEDMIYNRKAETYSLVYFKSSGTQLDPLERNAVSTVSTHPLQENQLENSDVIVTESQTSKAKSSRKRTSASSTPSPMVIEKLYSGGKKFKQLMVDIQDSADLTEDVKTKMDTANGAFDNLFNIIGNLRKSINSDSEDDESEEEHTEL